MELRLSDLEAAAFADAVARDGADFGPDFKAAFFNVFDDAAFERAALAVELLPFLAIPRAGVRCFTVAGLTLLLPFAAAGFLAGAFFGAAVFLGDAFFGTAFFAAGFVFAAADFFPAVFFASESSFFTAFTSAFAILTIFAAVFLTAFTAFAGAVFFTGLAGFLATLIVPPQDVDTSFT